MQLVDVHGFWRIITLWGSIQMQYINDGHIKQWIVAYTGQPLSVNNVPSRQVTLRRFTILGIETSNPGIETSVYPPLVVSWPLLVCPQTMVDRPVFAIYVCVAVIGLSESANKTEIGWRLGVISRLQSPMLAQCWPNGRCGGENFFKFFEKTTSGFHIEL